MKIAQVLSGSGNGASRHCHLLCRELAARGHQVSLFYSGGEPVERRYLQGVEVIATTLRRTRDELGRINRIMDGLGIEVMHSHMSRAHAFGALQRLFWGRPAVATAHSRHVQLHWTLNNLVIAPSRSTADFHHRFNLVPRRKLRVIHNFADLESFPRATSERRAAMRRALGIPPEAFVVGCVAIVNHDKNQSDLVGAVGRLSRRDGAAWLVLVGNQPDGSEARKIDRLIVEFGLSGRVLRLGQRTDVADLLSGFDIYAQTSRREEMPLSILEAMATGLPILGNATGGIAEALPEEDAPHLVRLGDLDGLADQLDELRRSPELRLAMAERSWRRAADELSPAAVVPRVEAVLAKAAAQRHPQHKE